MASQETRTGTRRPIEIPTFADVARLIVPNDTPLWLPAHLEWWAQGLLHDRLADKYRPTKVESRERLEAVKEAADLLRRELNFPSIRNLLEDAKSEKRISMSTSDLRDLSERADLARSSPFLTTKTDKGRAGRGKPNVRDLFKAKTLCAARVVELWLHFHEVAPGLANKKAAGIAQAYWLASGGRSGGPGDPLNGWYDYFKIVRDDKPSIGLMSHRLIWRRDLEQTVRRGRPPYFHGDLISDSESRN